MDIKIRDATPEDASEIVNILNPIIKTGEYTAIDTPFSEEAERGFISNFSKQGAFHVALNNENHAIVGFQTLDPFATYTHAFDHVGVVGTFINLSFRRQGIGSSLFQKTFTVARQKGYEKLFTFIRANNSAALACYQKHGFAIVGVAKKQAKINGEYIDEIFVEKFL